MGLKLRLIRAALALLLCAGAAGAETIRVASFEAGLSRRGPGLLLRDIEAGEAQAAAAVAVIVAARPDLLLLTGIDWDHDALALAALAAELSAQGIEYTHLFTREPNRGMPSGVDLDGDGRLNRAEDSQGWGMFRGQRGMAILSRYPLELIADHSAMLWRELPGHQIGDTLTAEAQAVQRLSTTAHWDLAVDWGARPLRLLTFGATAPLFDGGTGRNVRRNHDEIAFWNGHLPEGDFVLAGHFNLDPHDGAGWNRAVADLLADPRLQDPQPRGAGGAAAVQEGPNAAHLGDPALDTAEYGTRGAGNLRLSYVLPSAGLRVVGSGVIWPEGGELLDAAQTAGAHRLVWVDLARE
ncbi:MAG: endonuclease/exonuclease/phosphatase family protein [Paracoccus sp. (in: a-proteobacteria)]|nr:endonuclease/exonuclease/phosphatase family protein [Paracoccus sp. (in: a-proteobacteria)]